MRFTKVCTALLAVGVSVAVGQEAPRWDHRVWVTDGAPDAATLASLAAAGVDGYVVSVGEAEVAVGATTFTSRGHIDVKSLAPAPVSIAIHVSGAGNVRGDAASFWSQVSPAVRGLASAGSLILIAPHYWEGLPGFAAAVAKEAGRHVELMLSAPALAAAAPRGGWEELGLVAVALGRPEMLGFEGSIVDDDLDALDALEQLGVSYRVALVVLPRITPVPGPGRLNLRTLTNPETALYRIAGGDVFSLQRAIDWGGTTLAPATTIELDVTTSARYARDLASLLRPVRNGLRGWDTIALPPPPPTAGMSREAFIDYLRGGIPSPRPVLNTRWLSATRLELAIFNPGPHATGFGLGKNFVEVRYSGTELFDVQLGDFTAIEYGKIVAGQWQGVSVPRGADAVRFRFVYLSPKELLGGAVISFLSAPRATTARWSILPGDGTATAGPLTDVGRNQR